MSVPVTPRKVLPSHLQSRTGTPSSSRKPVVGASPQGKHKSTSSTGTTDAPVPELGEADCCVECSVKEALAAMRRQRSQQSQLSQESATADPFTTPARFSTSRTSSRTASAPSQAGEPSAEPEREPEDELTEVERRWNLKPANKVIEAAKKTGKPIFEPSWFAVEFLSRSHPAKLPPRTTVTTVLTHTPCFDRSPEPLVTRAHQDPASFVGVAPALVPPPPFLRRRRVVPGRACQPHHRWPGRGGPRRDVLVRRAGPADARYCHE